MKLVILGLGIGMSAAAALSRAMESQLFGVSTLDRSSFVAVIVLAITTLLTCLVQALRATRINPTDALRAD